MTLNGLIQCLGDSVQSIEEETFDLFAQELPSQNLGFVNPLSHVLEITVAGRDLTIHQSPVILSSNRAGGTTGAVLWKTTTNFADWIGSPDNILFNYGILSAQSTVVELGCGTSAVVGITLAPRISSYVLTDQSYVSRLLEQNIEENKPASTLKQTAKIRGAKPPGRGPKGSGSGARKASSSASERLTFRPLDWEIDKVTSSLTGARTTRSFDAVVCCDCIYNQALVEPFVQTCVDICKLRADDSIDEERVPCVCVVAQQLRDCEVFEAWLTRFLSDFDVWRVPDLHLVEGLRSSTGFVVHIGVLRGSAGETL